MTRPWTAQLVQDAHRLHRAGCSVAEIARAVDIDEKRVRQLLWLIEGYPELDPSRPAPIDTAAVRAGTSGDALRGNHASPPAPVFFDQNHERELAHCPQVARP